MPPCPMSVAGDPTRTKDQASKSVKIKGLGEAGEKSDPRQPLRDFGPRLSSLSYQTLRRAECRIVRFAARRRKSLEIPLE